MKAFPFILALICCSTALHAQTKSTDSLALITLNSKVDAWVVNRDVENLKKIYAPDFVFNHGSGKIEGTNGWMNSVMKGNFISRIHDSVTAEMHPELAVLRGTMHISKKNKEKTDTYHLRYVRIYARRNNEWQLVSHVTTHEYHDPS